MMRKRISVLLAIVATVVGVGGVMTLPVASADALPNGLTV